VSEVTWSGVFPAALTMFDRRGRLDLTGTRQHLERLIAEGADGLVVGGTSGEFIALDARERRRLTEVAVDAAAGRVPVIAGTGAWSTSATIGLTRHARAAGADGAIVILPYYQRPFVHEVLVHFEAVARAVDLPLMAYNTPTNSAAPALSAADLAWLHAHGAATAVKSTFPTVHQVHEARAVLPVSFRVFYGSFVAPLEGLAGGAHGWISGILNVVTPDARALVAAIAASDLPAAREAWARILPIKRLYTESLLGPVSDLVTYRAILDLRGAHGGHSRAPLIGLTADQRARLERHLRAHELLG
jgi:4-hydroxy-tetrahydrodipicolinate synthase